MSQFKMYKMFHFFAVFTIFSPFSKKCGKQDLHPQEIFLLKNNPLLCKLKNSRSGIKK